MPHKLLAQYDCSRCGRSWFENYVEGEKPKDPPKLRAALTLGPDSSGVLVSEVVDFDCLCENCTKVTRNLLQSICKDMKHKSPARTKKSVVEKAP